MRVNGFQCDGCGYFDPGRSGDQRDPGPFLPKDWWGGTLNGPSFCPACTGLIQAGALKNKQGRQS